MRTLHAHGAEIPVIGLGTYRLRGEEARDVVSAALAEGYRHIDTARAYGNEADVGRGIAQADVPRDAVVLVTKIWPDDFAPDAFIAAAEASLRDLGTDYIDLLLLHWPSFEVPVGETLGAMETLVADGKVRYAGVSNFTTSLFDEAAAATHLAVAANQVEHHPFLDQSTLRRHLAKHGAALVGYCPVAQGRVFKSDILSDIAADHGATPASVALAWALSKEGTAAVPKASSREHLRDNLAAADIALADDEIKAMDALGDSEGRLIDPGWAPDWD